MTDIFKPGDVALIRTGNGFDAVGLRSGIPSNMGWAYTSSDLSGAPFKYGNCWTSDRDGAAVIRRLVVIDAEDRERLRAIEADFARRCGWSLLSSEERVTALQAALREFANPTPPKPEEPTGLGAVVEDADGMPWVLYTHPDSTCPWVCAETSAEWDDITAVRVLSEGVTP